MLLSPLSYRDDKKWTVTTEFKIRSVSITFPKLSKFEFFIQKNSYEILKTLVKTVFVKTV